MADTYPLSRSKVTAQSKRQLKQMRDVGIRFVEIFGCNNPEDDCEVCLAMRGQTLPIQDAPTLPLPGCDKKHCKCIILAKS